LRLSTSKLPYGTDGPNSEEDGEQKPANSGTPETSSLVGEEIRELYIRET